MSHVLIVVVICAIIFVLVGLSSSLTLLLGYGLDLRSGDLPASNKQPQHFTLPLGSGIVRYLSLKVCLSTCSAILVGAGTPSCLRRNFRVPEVPAQTIETSDYHKHLTLRLRRNFKICLFTPAL